MLKQTEKRNLRDLVRENVANTFREIHSKPGDSDPATLEAVSCGLLDCWQRAERAVLSVVDDDVEGFIDDRSVSVL